jgi:DNA primase large subunit
VRILLSGNGIFRSIKAMSRSEKESFRLFCAISNEKTGVIPLQNRNVAMKNRNVAIDNGKVKVGERNVAEMKENFHASFIKRGMKNTAFETLYSARANAKEARRESGTLRKLSEKANKSFDVLCQITNGMLLMPLDDATKSVLEQIASLLNAQIYQYGVNYQRHVRIVDRKKKEDEK